MSRLPHRLLASSGGPTQYEKHEIEMFSRRLHEAMIKKGLSQSDLAAMIWGRTKDQRGYDVAKGRDRISVWLRGKAIPDPQNLKKLADTLELDVAELAPDITAATVEKENPEIAMTMIAGHADKVFLRVNMLVPLALASKVIAMLSEARPTSV
jgi:transcriptional regulator with XRE-family HTH domain